MASFLTEYSTRASVRRTDAYHHVATREWHPDQSSRNSGNKCRLARPLMVPNFVTLRQEVCKISTVENLCSRKNGPKFTKIH